MATFRVSRSLLGPLLAQCRSKGVFVRKYSALSQECVSLTHLDGERQGVAVLSMKRHEARNAISKQMASEMKEAVSSIRFDNNVRVVVIRSEVPRVFCAGADLKERAKMKPEEVGPFVAGLRQLLSDLENLPQPTIAALDGAALGGGLEMALACCLRTAGSTVKLGLVETSLAIIPGAGGTQRLPRLIGVSKAKELIYTSKILDGHQAASYGLVNYAVDQNESGDAAYHKALELAEQMATQGPIALRMAKLAINKGMQVDLQSGMALEESYYSQVIPTKDRVEGLTAFREKRRPVYKGE